MHALSGAPRAARLAFPACLALVLVAASGPRLSAAGAYDGPIRVWNHTWYCNSPQNGTQVEVRIVDHQPNDAVHLDAGCTGRLTVRVFTNGADGIKVHTGAHDLVVTGNITCDGRYGDRHQDGVQAMGGRNVQLGDGSQTGSFWVYCPSGNNGALFTNMGREHHSYPTDVVCDHCDLFERNVALHVGADSVASGARNSVLHRGTGDSSPNDCDRIEPGANQPVDQNNTCVGPEDDAPNYSFNPGIGP
jgi:hypothetical protein